VTTGTVSLVVADGVARVVIANPAKMNAMSLAMWQELGGLVRSLADDESVRVLVLRGEGTRAFVSGADIGEFDSTRSAQTGSEAYDQAFEEAQAALVACPVPVIASIHGICMGGGLALAVACDLRYADDQGRFRMPAARLGLGYSYSGIRRMVEVLGDAVVSELFFTARTYDAGEAGRIGIVNRAFADAATLDLEVDTVASAIAANAPLTVRLAKRSIGLARHVDAAAAAAEIADGRSRCLASADYVEGRRAFAEKRTPRFTGR